MADSRQQQDTKTIGGETLLQRLHDRDSLRTLFPVGRMNFEKMHCLNPATSKAIREVYALRKLVYPLDRLLSNVDDRDSWKRRLHCPERSSAKKVK
jgi:hypothetical protein